MTVVAVLGAGRIGAVHARSIAAAPDAELALVVDPVPGAAEALAGAHGARAAGDAAAAFQDPAIDAVVIGSPTRYHVQHILEGVAAGKALFVEKPIDLDLARADDCIRQVGAARDRVMVGFNRRFDPSTASLRQRVRDGEIGALEQLSIVSRDPAPPPAAYLRGSGGIFKDMVIHDFDTARSLLGEIDSVAVTGQHLDPDVEDEWDAAASTLVGVGGAVCTIVTSRHCATGYDQRIEAFGPLGSLRLENQVTDGVRAYTRDSAGATGPFQNFFLERYADAYRIEMDAFLRAVRGDGPMGPGLLDGRQALAIAEAATEAARTGTRVRVQPLPVGAA